MTTTVNLGKKQYANIILFGIILVLTTIFLIRNWSTGEESKLSSVLQFIATFCFMILIWLIGKDGLDSRDSLLLRFAFGFIIIADVFLVLLEKFANPAGHLYFQITGFCSFSGAQIFFIIRHLKNLKEVLVKLERKQIVFLIAIVIAIILLTLLKVFIILPYIKDIMVYITGGLYFFILAISLSIGWTTLHNRFFPKLNAWLIAVSMTVYSISDFCIILADIIKFEVHITKPLIWTLYVPASMLMWLSGYKKIPNIRKKG